MERLNQFVQVSFSQIETQQQQKDADKKVAIEKLGFSLNQIKSLIEGKLNLLQKMVDSNENLTTQFQFTQFVDQMTSSNSLIKSQIDLVKQMSKNNMDQTLQNKDENQPQENEIKSIIKNISTNQKKNNGQDGEKPSIKFNDDKIEIYGDNNPSQKPQTLNNENEKIFYDEEEEEMYGEEEKLNDGEYTDEQNYNQQMDQNQSDYFNYDYDDDDDMYDNDVYPNGYYPNQNQLRAQSQGFPQSNSYYQEQNDYDDQYQQFSYNQQPAFNQQYQINRNNNYIMNSEFNQQRFDPFNQPNRINSQQDYQPFNGYAKSNIQKRYQPKPLRNQLEIQKRLQAYKNFEAQYGLAIPFIFKSPFYLEKTARQRFFQHLSADDCYAVAMMYEHLGTQQLVADLLDTSLPNIKKILTYVKSQIEQGLYTPGNNMSNHPHPRLQNF